ncbi:hypothetical protein MRB53_003725 [Persea americana]|uniref:Uncharacterized protein n=1 Tax=Persea americana TaxID=3435 RepID=A0ACC2N1F9_PERAE|nr:hypothetical protein MRB53_003725 [Persea americana]
MRTEMMKFQTCLWLEACLGLVSKTVGDAIGPFAMPFIESSLVKADWGSRRAATFAFGSILEADNPEVVTILQESTKDVSLVAPFSSFIPASRKLIFL